MRQLPRIVALALIPFLFVFGPSRTWADPPPQAVAAFDAYVRSVEERLARQHRSADGFVTPEDRSRLEKDELIVEHIAPPDGDPHGAMFHHWRGTAFVPGATASDFEALMRDIDAYPQHFAPDVVRARLLSAQGNHLRFTMRVRQKHGITVVLDATYDLVFDRLDPHHRFSTSHSTRITEIESAGTPKERELSPSEDHGFLWRLNTYWTCEERDGGLLMQIETVSLTRSIPAGLGWIVRPFVESVPRESLEFTLRSVRDALRKQSPSSSRR